MTFIKTCLICKTLLYLPFALHRSQVPFTLATQALLRRMGRVPRETTTAGPFDFTGKVDRRPAPTGIPKIVLVTHAD